MINYSFIIPHKNSRNLLERCIASIPERQDIEIVVVDDNSKETEKPNFLRDGIRIVYVGENDSKGAGKARNIGLNLAKGKWILFADCDDFYEENFILKLDQFVNMDYDVVFFDSHFNYNLDNGLEQETRRCKYLSKYIQNAEDKRWKAFLMHCDNNIWSRMFSKKFLDSIDAKFEEIPVANDIFFANYTSVKAEKIHVILDKLYYYLKNSGSLTNSKNTREKMVTRFMAGAKRNRILANSKNAIALSIIFPFGLYKKSLKDFGFFFLCKMLIMHVVYDVSIFTVLYWKIRARFIDK